MQAENCSDPNRKSRCSEQVTDMAGTADCSDPNRKIRCSERETDRAGTADYSDPNRKSRRIAEAVVTGCGMSACSELREMCRKLLMKFSFLLMRS